MVDIRLFGNETIFILKKNGWFPKRLMNTRIYEATWQREGYINFQKALDFSSRFGEIKISHESYSGKDQDISNFDPIAATQEIDSAWVLDVYQPLINENLIPVGRGNSGHLTYFISKNGGIYGGFDDFFREIGKSINDAFENIFFRHEYIQL